MTQEDIHINTKVVKCRKEHACQKCNRTIKVGELAFRTNTKFIKPFYRCMSKNCKPRKEEVIGMIQDEMLDYHLKNKIEIEEGDF